MHNQSPDELAFYTKDSDLYSYDAMVNQLSITSLDALGANPLMLLADIDNVIWDEYEVLREGEFFTLVPRHPQDVQSLTMAFAEGTSFLSALTIRMDDGNTNFYLFSEQSAQVDPTVFDFKLFYLFSEQSAQVDPTVFDFKLPEDVEIDDMR